MPGAENTPILELVDPPREGMSPVLICAGQAVTSGATEGARLLEIGAALEIGRGRRENSGLVARFETADPHMSRVHVLLRQVAPRSVVVRDMDSRNGTFVDGLPLSGERALEDGAVLFMGAHVFVYRLISAEDLAAIAAEHAHPFARVPTLSPRTARLCERLRRLARSEVDLLLGGETGVGKEVFAEAVHRESGRSGALVAINCAALPDTLLESELFGYARGAHSMADQTKPGLIEQAEGGTLFLDEIGDMSSAGQSKLLRFLQDRQVLALGGTKPRRLDVRVVAATRRPIAESDEAPGVRFDLAARLGPEPLMIPPLRARAEDIGLLTRFFLREHPRPFETRAFRALFLHRWPGNVRELEKTLQMAAVLSEGHHQIGPEHLPLTAHENDADLGEEIEGERHGDDLMSGIEDVPASAPRATPTPEALAVLLERHRGNVGHVARELRRQRTLVWRWLRKAGLDPAQFRASRENDTPS
jgi:transcriptional regulator with PAS, ATPase and Fis domain